MITKIFDLICRKLDFSFKIQDNTDVNERFDFIIIDQDFIDNKFNLIKQFSNKIGAITNEELPFEKSRDFLIPRPFLPHDLQNILEEQIEVIKDEKREARVETKKFVQHDSYDSEDTDDLTVFIENLADDVALDIEDESDESIVSLASLRDGGILDKGELGKISSMLKEGDIESQFLKEYTDDEDNMNEADWKELSEIIDEALIEVSSYEFDLDYTQPINLILNNYNVDELKPLLNKLNQGVIEKLSQGKSIDLKLTLKV